ncbi:MAG: hypothetical protein H7066_06045 [Cytophagaceae bacterium]|nr:hypothetical protein [Gemmatimonadaceae bacterium]
MTSPINGTQANALAKAFVNLLQGPAQVAASLANTLAERARAGGCDIPAPCWEPQHAGTCAVCIAPGGTAVFRVIVSNCGWSRQVVMITAMGQLAGWITFGPTSVILEPMEKNIMQVKIQAPDNASIGSSQVVPVIIRGCRDHYIRVEVTIANCAIMTTCCDMLVEDCADNVHHWYDHFYCARPCASSRGDTGGGVKDG